MGPFFQIQGWTKKEYSAAKEFFDEKIGTSIEPDFKGLLRVRNFWFSLNGHSGDAPDEANVTCKWVADAWCTASHELNQMRRFP